MKIEEHDNSFVIVILPLILFLLLAFVPLIFVGLAVTLGAK